jgi:F-type H+-transporting ATPase subunit b
MAIFEDAHFWEAVGLALLVIGLIYLKVPGMAVAALDDRTNRIKSQLAEATRLREEAERLLAEIRVQREATEHQAEEIMALAKIEAERLGAESKVRLEEQVRRRADQAERRIAMAEAQAAAEVRTAAADRAAQAAEAILAARLANAKTDPLVDAAVAQIPAKLQ